MRQRGQIPVHRCLFRELKDSMKNDADKAVAIASLHRDGYGLSADGGQAVYGSLPGETVLVRRMGRKRKTQFGRTVSVIQGSDTRVEPACAAANVCGGCSFQHMSPEAQLAFKHELLASEFSSFPPAEWLPPVQDSSLHYRSKARLGVRFVEKKGRVLVGFREKMKPYIAETGSCSILRRPVSDLLEPLAELVGQLRQPGSVPQIEVAVGDVETALVIRHLEPLDDDELHSMEEFARTRELQLYLQPGNLQSVYRLYPVEGPERLYYRLPNQELELAFHPLDFTQVNHGINQKMVDLAVSLLAAEKRDRVLDAFCGIGNFSLPLARTAGFVTGLEGSSASVERARENAVRNTMTNTAFHEMDLFAGSLEFIDSLEFNKVLVDPPRSGAEALCEKLASGNLERLVYVSCNPGTLARDTKILVDRGFELERLGIIDMFPHTTHVESIALLTRSRKHETW